MQGWRGVGGVTRVRNERWWAIRKGESDGEREGGRPLPRSSSVEWSI